MLMGDRLDWSICQEMETFSSGHWEALKIFMDEEEVTHSEEILCFHQHVDYKPEYNLSVDLSHRYVSRYTSVKAKHRAVKPNIHVALPQCTDWFSELHPQLKSLQ